MKNKKIISAIAILLAVLMLVTLVVGMLPASVFADGEEQDFSVNPNASLAELQARKEQLGRMAEDSQNKIAELQNEQATLIEQKVAYDERDAYIHQQIDITREQIELYRGLIANKQKEVEQAKRLEDEQLERYRARVRSMEENGEYNILTLILNARSFNAFLSGIDDIRDVMESDRRLEDKYIAAREEHERVRAEYEAEKAEYDEKMVELEDEQQQLSDAIRETEKLMQKLEEELEKNVREYEAAMAAQETASEAIDARIAQLYAAYLAAQAAQAQQAQQAQQGGAVSTGENGSTATANTSGQGATGNAGVSGSGSFVWPVPGCYSVSSEYGTRTHPITGEVSRMHYGMDIDGYAHDGGNIIACDSGVVSTVGYNSGYGNYIIVDHGNGVQTLYAHMSDTAVTQGTTIGKGETIGYLGATGMATGTHCHLEVFVDGQNVDPSDYFG